MAHQVAWTKYIVETFIEEAMLSEEEIMILRTRAMGWTRTKQSVEFGMSLSTIYRIIKMLKIKYDKVEKNNPGLPPRKFSAEETYMDSH